jgi:hypothetical protein
VTANDSPGQTYNPEWKQYDASGSPAEVVFGSREGVESDLVERCVYDMPKGTILVNGGARGVDWDALNAALCRKMSVIVLPAQWSTYNNAAGPIRNGIMAKIADRGEGFRCAGRSQGTDNMELQLRRLRKTVAVNHA